MVGCARALILPNQKKTRAVSVIIAVLILILIAIAAAVLVYAYASTYVGNSLQNPNTSDSLSIDNLLASSGYSGSTSSCKTKNCFPILSFVRNLGPASEAFTTGFFLSSSTFSEPVVPTLLISDAGPTLSGQDALTGVSLSGTGSVLTVTLTVTCGTGASTINVQAFGVSGTGALCAASMPFTLTVPSGNGVTFVNSQTTGKFSSSLTGASTGATIGIKSQTYYSLIGTPLDSGAKLNIAYNVVGEISLGLAASITAGTFNLSTNPISTAGITYSLQVVGVDGGTVTATAVSS